MSGKKVTAWGMALLMVLGALAVHPAKTQPVLADGEMEKVGYLSAFNIALGHHSSAAISADGDLYAWGRNGDGQLGLGDTTDRSTPTKVSDLSDVIAVSLGRYHSAALTANGDLYTWGRNGHGQLGLGDTTNRYIPTKVSDLSDVIAISLGDSHNAALTANGDLYTWGWNGSGKLGHGDYTDKHIPTKVIDLSDVIAISLGDIHSAALTVNGDLYTWGMNTEGQLGHSSHTTHSIIPTKVSDLSDVIAISLGTFHSAALTANGDLYTWGWNGFGQLGLGHTADRHIPTKVSDLSDVIAISLGGTHSSALKANGDLYTWGWNDSGQLGHGNTTNRLKPTRVSDLSDVMAVSLGYKSSGALTANGNFYTWGLGYYGQLGSGDTNSKVAPHYVYGIPGYNSNAPTPTHTPTPTATPNPTPDNLESFVKRIYTNVLEREPDKDGLYFWVNGLKNGDENAESIIDSFVFSTEFLSRNVTNEQFVKIAYNTLMDREPDTNFWVETLEKGFNRRYVTDKFLMSDEFTAICADYEITVGPVAGLEGFVARMYRNVLGRRYDTPGLTWWVDALQSGHESAMSIANHFFQSEEFLARGVSNEAFVDIAYKTLMNRDPNAIGMEYWLNELINGANHNALLDFIMHSWEFKEICDDYGINTGLEYNEQAAANITEDKEIIEGTRADEATEEETESEETEMEAVELEEGGPDYWADLPESETNAIISSNEHGETCEQGIDLDLPNRE